MLSLLPPNRLPPPSHPPNPPSRLGIRAFLNQLHSDVVRLEFAHYDSNGDGFIKGIDFANSIAAAADVQSVDEFLDRVRAGVDRGMGLTAFDFV